MSNNPTPLLGDIHKGLLFVLSAPAGTGKTTLVEMLMEEFSCVQESVSLTTRPPRSNEVDGKHYYFVSEEEFKEKIEAGEFLEHAKVFGYRYGTSSLVLRRQQEGGSHVILTIDTQGALQVKGKVPAVFIFLRPPSTEELSRRLYDRKTESEEVIAERLRWSEKELALAKQYDYNIINDDLNTAYQVLRSILIAEEHRVRE